ncbi:MAG: HDIG domain-containing protein [Prevotellaceae bacterium]|jgi:putative nucleotidyltransferase with HDIG domain|nr:HDIG domain-containing protein [Prevotellaceae bacterium]
MSSRINIVEFRKALILFFIASIAILFFIPTGGKFKYEFHQGQPWMHEDFNAPFDFPVYKTDAELLEERRLVSEKSLHYFVLDSLSVIKQLNMLKEQTKSEQGERLFSILHNPFISLYKRGIIEDFKYSELKSKSIAIVRGNTYEEIPVSELFTPGSACEYLQNTALKTVNDDDLTKYVKNLNLSRFIITNLTFDESLTSKIRQKNINAILPTEGMVTEGTKIIEKGEQTTPEAFKILSSLKREYEKNTVEENIILTTSGRLLFILMCMGCVVALLMTFRRSMLTDTKCMIFIVLLLTGFIILALQISKLYPMFIYALPLTIVPIYVSSFFYSRPAIFIHFFMTVIIGNFVPNSFEFIFINSLAGVTAVIGFKKSYERGQLFLIGFLIFAVYLTGYTSLKLLHEGNLEDLTWFVPCLLFINCLLVIILYQFTFLFESLFGFVSVSRLVELSDTNRKLLRELTEIAPGTAQHVLQVANIAEAVIREIGGDPLLVRAGALYHDIGKMKNPVFFIENQLSNISPHLKISPEESAKIIIEHVTYGVELARKHHLPNAIIDFITSHHGKSKVHYFYAKYLSANPDDVEAVSKFSYPGPNPSTKEMVSVMMADSCEAASRSLPNPNEQSLNAMVDKIIERQYSDGLYNDSNITLKEINLAKQVIKYKLKNIFHARIEYPETNK